MNKIINSLSISNTNTLDANGGKRGITISGQVGAKFSLTIKDSSNRNILEDYYNNIGCNICFYFWSRRCKCYFKRKSNAVSRDNT